MPTVPRFDPLWVPVLTHYQVNGELRLDTRRTADHLHHLTPNVTQYLIAGTTGDGWEMPDSVLLDWLDLVAEGGPLTSRHTVLFGAFAKTTRGVIARAKLIEDYAARHPLAARFAGLTLCAPVVPDADQKTITDHFQNIIDATTSPIAIYQLPQITHCEIAPQTFSELAQRNPRITLFKDTSGTDLVAQSGLPFAGAKLLRGAEGNYHKWLAPLGPYAGWLLSTANVFAAELRTIATLAQDGRGADALVLSAGLSKLVASLFDLAGPLPMGNPFSNANRAVDHLFAYGKDWHLLPLPKLASGETLPETFLMDVEKLLNQASYSTRTGYRVRPAA